MDLGCHVAQIDQNKVFRKTGDLPACNIKSSKNKKPVGFLMLPNLLYLSKCSINSISKAAE